MRDIKIQPPAAKNRIVDESGFADHVFLRFLNQVRDRAGVAPQVVDVPASAVAAGSPGQIAYDANYFYICVDTDTWKRVGIAAW